MTLKKSLYIVLVMIIAGASALTGAAVGGLGSLGGGKRERQKTGDECVNHCAGSLSAEV